MAAEDYTSWSPGEDDTAGDFVVAASSITVTSNVRPEDNDVIDDKGSGHFSGDFTHTVPVTFVSRSSDAAINTLWALQNTTSGTPFTQEGASQDCISTRFQTTTATVYDIRLRNAQDTAQDESINLYSYGPDFWLEIERDEAASTYGDVDVRIYDDEYITLRDTISISLDAKIDYQYIRMAGGWHTSGGMWMDYTIGELDLQEAAPSGNPWYYYAQQ